MPAVAYSGKKKKLQLKERRERKKGQKEGQDERDDVQGAKSGRRNQRGAGGRSEERRDTKKKEEIDIQALRNEFLTANSRKFNPDRYRLMFFRESNTEITRRKELSRDAYETLPETSLETCIEDIYKPGSSLDIPKRPPWKYEESRNSIEQREQRYFREYLVKIFNEYSPADLSYFELNVETWRQLWRVLEMSDVLLLITDVRHPALHFPPALYNHILKDLNKQIILILNKIDLVPPSLVVAWQRYFRVMFPDLHIVCFSSYPKHGEEEVAEDFTQVYHKKRKRKRVTPVGPAQLYDSITAIAPERDLSTWREKLADDWSAESGDDDSSLVIGQDTDLIDDETNEEKTYITLGCLGYPNVGKSSVLNALMGKKVVSVSRQPGHTKHFQTIFLTPHVRICDCPGLVFPSLVNKSLQILAGIYPISQVRDPYSPITYLAQRIPLPNILSLPQSTAWSSFLICDAWAEKRGFTTARTARNDIYRAANNLLRLAVEGRLRLCFYPPSFTENKEYWEKHQETADLRELLRKNCVVMATDDVAESQDSDSPDDEHGEEDDGDEDDDDEEDVKTNNPYALLGDD